MNHDEFKRYFDPEGVPNIDSTLAEDLLYLAEKIQKFQQLNLQVAAIEDPDDKEVAEEKLLELEEDLFEDEEFQKSFLRAITSMTYVFDWEGTSDAKGMIGIDRMAFVDTLLLPTTSGKAMVYKEYNNEE